MTQCANSSQLSEVLDDHPPPTHPQLAAPQGCQELCRTQGFREAICKETALVKTILKPLSVEFLAIHVTFYNKALRK